MTIYQHFREEERPFIDSILEWKSLVAERYTPKLTDFLDPRQQHIIKALISESDQVVVKLWGGYENAERKRALLLPPYYDDIGVKDLGVSLLELNYSKKFVKIEHRHLLGSLMGLGLKREKFGDLLLTEDRTQLLLAEELEDFVRLNLNQVGRHPVSCTPQSFDELVIPSVEWDERQGSVASLRLDAVLAEIYRQPRSKMTEFIKAGLVKVNWKVVEKAAYELTPGDALSVRGFGRSRIVSIEGETRKGNIWVKFGILN
ncbi:MAG TPA: YlmH/Sll1252 family protein [Candidatus Angelobacter sp.]|nr:YlmH/Sll1252 family protein [Candidatus Angelobacter sp.]